jgi:hypothetical protein
MLCGMSKGTGINPERCEASRKINVKNTLCLFTWKHEGKKKVA